MHTEVNVPNPSGALLPGVYAEATLTLTQNRAALTVPLESVERESDQGMSEFPLKVAALG
ncbi:MAG: hypothetical protein M3Y72_25785 [Acidobacteriota bacterium]|nr:hypothetical protein [Acidobacteriota bacterium]